jgi:myosin-5
MEIGADVWVPDEDEAWLKASVVNKFDGSCIEVVAQHPEDIEERIVDLSTEPDGAKLMNVFEDELGSAGVHDLITLTHLHEPAILNCMECRFFKDIIYTATGPILLAINPFKRLDL